jgi:peptidoglycan/LPS O-acetylase OafA/YrhL
MGGRAVERVETRPQAAAPLAPDAPTSGGRIATLDGLRGLAILLVMFSHFAIANPPTEHWINQALSRAMRTGWIGVDLFFVLSGFLITGILVDARGHAGYFRNFYMRRVLRIFPLYYASLLVLVVVLPTAVGPTPGMVQMQADAAWYWLYLANIKIAVSGWTTGLRAASRRALRRRPRARSARPVCRTSRPARSRRPAARCPRRPPARCCPLEPVPRRVSKGWHN